MNNLLIPRFSLQRWALLRATGLSVSFPVVMVVTSFPIGHDPKMVKTFYL